MNLVAYSADDHAGVNIARILLEEFKLDARSVVRIEPNIKEMVSLPFTPDLLIVASRHKSESGTPTLTCHATGNFGPAELGGFSRSLQETSALHLRSALLLLQEYQRAGNLGFDVSLEVTHHGPTSMPFPLIFVEVGSTSAQWDDVNACRIVARVISELLVCEPERVPVAVGFGGPHYAPNFTAVADRVAVGHIASKHVAGFLDEAMVRQMIGKTVPKPSFALFDWKGLRGEERNRIMGILNSVGLPYCRTSEFKE